MIAASATKASSSEYSIQSCAALGWRNDFKNVFIARIPYVSVQHGRTHTLGRMGYGMWYSAASCREGVTLRRVSAPRTDRLIFEPLVPSPLDCIGLRPFAFYPAIKNFSSNQWRLGLGSWTEVQVVNAASGAEIWISRQYVGAVSESSGPIPIVGLRKELEYRNGVLAPCIKRVIEMPQSSEESPNLRDDPERRPERRGAVIGIRIEHRENSPMNKALVALGIAFIISFLAFAASVVFARP